MSQSSLFCHIILLFSCFQLLNLKIQFLLKRMKLSLFFLVAAEAANNGIIYFFFQTLNILVLNIHWPNWNSGRHHISKQESNSMLTLSREKRFLKEVFVKREPHYRRYYRESLRELIMYSCPRLESPEEST